MKRTLRRSWPEAGRAALSGGTAATVAALGERRQHRQGLLRVGRVELEHLGLEGLEQRFTAPQPVACFLAVGRPEPVARLDAPEPCADLVELHAYLLRLLIAVVAAEMLELDLLDE